jgi:hypothetical protein
MTDVPLVAEFESQKRSKSQVCPLPKIYLHYKKFFWMQSSNKPKNKTWTITG